MSKSECWTHNTTEDSTGAYKVCDECGHVFMTKKDIMEAARKTWADGNRVLPHLACPLCANNW